MQLCAMDAGHEEELMKNIKHLGAAAVNSHRPCLPCSITHCPSLSCTCSSSTLPHQVEGCRLKGSAGSIAYLCSPPPWLRDAGRNISSCRSQSWPECLPVSGLLTFDFVSKRVRKEMEVIEARKLQSLLSQLQVSTRSTRSTCS